MTETANANEKKPWMSKTLWISAITALAPIVYPPAAVWIASQPEVFAGLIGLVFTGLRFVTEKPVQIPLKKP